MKLLDLNKCHGDSPDFRASLSQLEEAANLLEKRMKTISSLCEERRALSEKENAVTSRIIREFDLISSSDPCLPAGEDWDTAVNSVEVMTTAMRQLLDNRERMFDQINIGIVRPLQHFLNQELEQVKSSKKTYYKAHSEVQQITEKFGQCKKHELHLLNEIALQLFDARADLHKATCTYALDLNYLHSKKTPDFLNRVVDFMMSKLSFFHLGHVTVKDVEPHITTVYTLVEKLRTDAMSLDTKQRSHAQHLMEAALCSRSQSLLHLYTNDLHTPIDTARGTISEHLAKVHPDSVLPEKQLDMPSRSATPTRTKAGYMWYAEPKTFGIHWIRLYFYIKNSMLLSESTAKVKIPISLNLNLCNVKPAEVNDTERNFSFKVTSPSRVLLLQAEGSLEMQDWLDTLSNAITHAIYGASSAMQDTEKKNGNGTKMENTEAMPIKPPRRKSNVSKDLSTIPGNEVCAECGSNRPKWASVNLGVLICIECSGVHRSLGVYISQVRSLTLDSLKPSVVRRLKTLGNTKSNAVYEETLPEDFDRKLVKKGENRGDFIMEKYITMKYTSPENKERILRERQEAREESLRKSGVHSVPTNSIPQVKEKTDCAHMEKKGEKENDGGGGEKEKDEKDGGEKEKDEKDGGEKEKDEKDGGEKEKDEKDGGEKEKDEKDGGESEEKEKDGGGGEKLEEKVPEKEEEVKEKKDDEKKGIKEGDEKDEEKGSENGTGKGDEKESEGDEEKGFEKEVEKEEMEAPQVTPENTESEESKEADQSKGVATEPNDTVDTTAPHVS